MDRKGDRIARHFSAIAFLVCAAYSIGSSFLISWFDNWRDRRKGKK